MTTLKTLSSSVPRGTRRLVVERPLAYAEG